MGTLMYHGGMPDHPRKVLAVDKLAQRKIRAHRRGSGRRVQRKGKASRGSTYGALTTDWKVQRSKRDKLVEAKLMPQSGLKTP